MSSSSVKKRPSAETDDRNPKRAKHAETGAGDDGASASASAGAGGEPDLLKGVEKLYSVGAIAIPGRGRCLTVLSAASGDSGGVDIPVYGLLAKNVSASRLRFQTEADCSTED